MQENEFEKQVKDTMDDFYITPSDAAWENVSRRIGGDKRKKRYFIFFLLVGLIIAGYFGYEFQKNTGNVAGTVTEKKDAAGNNITTTKASQSALKDSGKNNLPLAVSPSQKTNNDINKANLKAPIKNSANAKKNTNFLKQQQKFNGNADYTMLHKNDGQVTTVHQSSAINETPVTVNQTNVQTAEQTVAATAFDSSHQADVAKNTLPLAEDVINDSSSLHSDANVATTIQQTVVTGNKNDVQLRNSNAYKIPKWQWGITAGYGKANLAKGKFSAEKSSQLNLATSGITRNGISPAKIFTNSNAFHFGVTAQRKISGNSVIGVGLNYLHLSVKNGVSRSVDSGALYTANVTGLSVYTVARYYSYGNASKFINKYDFIELPVYFQQDIFHTNSTSLSYNAGFSVRRLIADKALVYDHFNGVYYTDNSLLRKTQFQLSGGLNFKFNTGKSNAVFIGPQFSYSLSNLINDKSKGNFHFINYGIQAGLLFHKK